MKTKFSIFFYSVIFGFKLLKATESEIRYPVDVIPILESSHSLNFSFSSRIVVGVDLEINNWSSDIENSSFKNMIFAMLSRFLIRNDATQSSNSKHKNLSKKYPHRVTQNRSNDIPEHIKAEPKRKP